MDLLNSGLNILVILIGFGLLIFVHELGHFLAAKWAGIRTEGFSIGFGPPICSWRKGIGFRFGSTYEDVRRRTGRLPGALSEDELSEAGLGETEYALRWLPLGGFVRMLGQDDVNPAATSSNQRSFNQRPIGKRMVVISAGVVMNMIFAGVLFLVAFTIGVRFESPIIGQVDPGSPAATAVPENGVALGVDAVGLLPGDRVLDIDGKTISTFGDLQIETAMGRPDVDLHFTVQREGVSEPLQFTMRPRTEPVSGLMGIGIMPASSTRLLPVDEFPLLPSYLDRIGLGGQGIEPGMTLSTVDGEPVWNYEAYSQLSESSNGAGLMTTWVVVPEDDVRGTGRTVTVELEPVPQWQKLRYPGATPSTLVGFEDGLLGLVPLVQLTTISADSPNNGLLEPGDIVLRFGSHQAPRMQTFRQAIVDHGAGSVSMTVLRDGKRLDVVAKITETGIFNPRPLMGVTPSYAWNEPLLAQPMHSVASSGDGEDAPMLVSTPVASLGLLGASRILSIDGVDVSTWRDIWQAMHKAAGRSASSMTMVVMQPTPGQALRTVEIPLDAAWSSDLSMLGWNPSLPFFLFEHLYVLKHADGNPFKAMVMGLQETASFAVLTYLTIDRLFRGTVKVEHLQGPVGIVHIGSKVADRGFSYLLFFLGLISVNLAVINFLPLPIVDGGLFLYLIYESIKGRPPSIGFQNGAAIVGLLLIATAFVVTFYNDIARIVG
ncbi:MAG: site-2 protease family protein [Phycisphaerales bacterium]|nr:site-2 protease family protein [Phycisphaerales bacterium]